MTRFAPALLAALGLAGPAPASRPEPPALPRPDTLPAKKAPAEPAEYVLDRDAEVVVDGKRCAYKDVPADARVVRVEVAEDRRTVLRIEFRTAKGSPPARVTSSGPRPE
jgi:hypothetical protein